MKLCLAHGFRTIKYRTKRADGYFAGQPNFDTQSLAVALRERLSFEALLCLNGLFNTSYNRSLLYLIIKDTGIITVPVQERTAEIR